MDIYSKLNKEQIDFLNSEFGIESSNLKNMTAEEWDKIRLRAFEIEAALIPNKNRGKPPLLCRLATSIIDADVGI